MSPLKASINLNEFVGYIVSGTLAIVVIYWLFINFFQLIPLKVLDESISVGDSIIFLITSFLAGHLSQSFGFTNIYRFVHKELNTFFEKFYVAQFESELSDMLEAKINYPRGTKTHKEYIKDNFDLCHSFVVQKELIKDDFFTGMLTLYKGTRNVMFLGLIVCILILAKHILFFPCPLPWTDPRIWGNISDCIVYYNYPNAIPRYLTFDLQQLIYSIIGIPIFWCSIKLWDKRFEGFMTYFFDTVYKQLYIWLKFN